MCACNSAQLCPYRLDLLGFICLANPQQLTMSLLANFSPAEASLGKL